MSGGLLAGVAESGGRGSRGARTPRRTHRPAGPRPPSTPRTGSAGATGASVSDSNSSSGHSGTWSFANGASVAYQDIETLSPGPSAAVAVASVGASDGAAAAQAQRSEVRALIVTLASPAMLTAGQLALSLLNTGGSGSSNSSGGAQLNLVAYSTPKPAYDKLTAQFAQTSAGKGITFAQSFGASGAQSRAVAPKLRRLGAAMKGKTATMVCSVNNCMRPRIAMRNPRLYPNSIAGSRQDKLSGSFRLSAPSAMTEDMMATPAAAPDQNSDPAGRQSSSSPCRRTTS